MFIAKAFYLHQWKCNSKAIQITKGAAQHHLQKLYCTQSLGTEFVASSQIIEHSQDANEVIAEYGLKPSHLFQVQPELQKHVVVNWKEKLKLFKENGLSELQVQRILTTSPQVMDISTDVLTETINNYRRLKLGERKLFEILYKYSFYLLIPPDKFKARVEELFKVFPRKDIQRLFKKLPEAFIDPWNVIYEKVEYCFFQLRLEQNEVIRSHMLRYDMQHIKLRHQFALRCVSYKTPKPNPIRHPVDNPQLADILHSSVDDFVELCNMTLEEYEIFNKVLAKEKSEDDELTDECETPADYTNRTIISYDVPKSRNVELPKYMSV